MMLEFADSTGVTGHVPPRRYLWTDAFAVRNFLELFERTNQDRYRQLALDLVDQVHHLLGRHRADDSRSGWISGLAPEEAERHPTCGGLRIGKELPERQRGEPADPQLEWERDGQYFHYLTRWMQALHEVRRKTGDDRYLVWAQELAVTAHRAFTYEVAPGGSKRMFWKMSIDLSRPLVESMGHHDPLDGLITCLDLETAGHFGPEKQRELSVAIEDFDLMCTGVRWGTEDPLGIGGLLEGAARLCRLVRERAVERRELLMHLLREGKASLQVFSRSVLLRQPADYRLAFRELGLAIGLHVLAKVRHLAAGDTELQSLLAELQPYQPLARQIDGFWSDPAARRAAPWREHREINDVMLAASLAAHRA